MRQARLGVIVYLSVLELVYSQTGLVSAQLPSIQAYSPISGLNFKHFQEELKREMAIQKKKNEREQAMIEREHKEAQAQEHKIRGKLLAHFEEETRKESEKQRLAEKESKS